MDCASRPLDRGKIRYTTLMEWESQGFREVEHTADWEIEVWAPDLPALLEQAARGMYALTNTRLAPAPRQRRELSLSAPDRESLLVAFLEELRYLAEVEGIAFDNYVLELPEDRLIAQLEGAPLISESKEIKAVTYHNLVIRESDQGLRVNIVFDV